MIPPDAALAAWVGVSFLLTAILPGYKAFTWSFLLALFFMPSHLPSEFQIEGLPALDRETVVAYGMLPATLLFHMNQLRGGFRYDFLFLPLVLLAGYASLANGQALYDGMSASIDLLLRFVLIVLLVRIHFRSREHAVYFLRSLIAVAGLYAILLLWEWRMSPQAHVIVYGYFPHSFAQMMRGGFFRPIGFFGHGLDVGYLYALVVPVGLALHKSRELGLPTWLLLLCGLGLASSMSLGPILFCAFCVLLVRRRSHRTLGAGMAFLPFGLLAVCLLAVADQDNFAPLLELFNEVSEERAESLSYRLNAFEYYMQNILNRPIFGHGGWGHGLNPSIATDSVLLLNLIVYGFAFVGILYLWYYRSLRHLGQLVNESLSREYDFVAATLYFVLFLAIIYDFIVIGTALNVVVICVVYLGHSARDSNPVAATDTPVPAARPAMGRPA
jgi:hypothetical protein